MINQVPRTVRIPVAIPVISVATKNLENGLALAGEKKLLFFLILLSYNMTFSFFNTLFLCFFKILKSQRITKGILFSVLLIK